MSTLGVSVNSKCEICGVSKGKRRDHTACSKIKQAQHANDVRRKTEKRLSSKAQRHIIAVADAHGAPSSYDHR